VEAKDCMRAWLDSYCGGLLKLLERNGLWCGCLLNVLIALPLSSCVPLSGQQQADGPDRRLNFVELEQVVPGLRDVRASVSAASSYHNDPETSLEQLDLFAEVFQLTRDNYISFVPEEFLVSQFLDGIARVRNIYTSGAPILLRDTVGGSLQQMLRQLDPHSDYLDPNDFQKIKVKTKGKFSGVGVEMTMERGYVKCVGVIPGTPASRSVIRPGDIISHIDGVSLKGISLIDVVGMIRGPVGTAVMLKLFRYDIADSFEIAIVRDVIRVNTIEARMEKGIGYVRISAFNENTYAALRKTLRGLTSDFDGQMLGLVLDLRNNPGGLLDQALRVSDAFLTKGYIISVVGRVNGEVRSFKADSEDIARGVPLAVLINGSTASAAEIVSGALKDRGRAVVLGQRSFGKGSVQSIIPLSEGNGALRLTTSLYYFPSGRSIQVHGITPDIVDVTPSHSSREIDLEYFLQPESQGLDGGSMTLLEVCPGSSKTNDPVLSCAIQTLKSRPFPLSSVQLAR